ncbi:MAG TPA: C25 family cysteine peptidase, partial [Planctomycetota bacterium]|nr:C25 family cysteine peptidase [Planctomycetota bacterium]
VSAVKNVSEPGDDLGRPRPNRLLVSRVALVYETRFATPSTAGKQDVVHIVGGDRPGSPRRLRIESRHQGGHRVFDPERGLFWRGEELEVADAPSITLCTTTADGAFAPLETAALRTTDAHLAGPGAEWVAITTSRLRGPVEALAKHRAAQGLSTRVVEARELYDTFTDGRFSPAAIEAFVKAAHGAWTTKPRYLLLAGDADLDGDFPSEKETLPARLVNTAYNGATATDATYGDVDGDGLPDVAVGRIAVRSPEEALAVVRRIVRSETESAGGAWRRTATFFAGEGRFGPAVDRLIESVTGDLISREIPPEFAVSMTYANPSSAWFWPAPRFNDAVIDAFNRGAAVFTYIGHGYPEGFDRVEHAGKRYPILSVKDVERLDNGGRAGVTAIIACSTGHFDDPARDCLAEKLLARTGGPLAVIASTRISHPFANALLGKGLVASAFKPGARVGDVLDEAKRRMVKEAKGPLAMLAKPHVSKAVDLNRLALDHVRLYALFGDPATLVPFPANPESFAAPETAAPGASIDVAVTVGGGARGDVSLRLERPRRTKLAESRPAVAADDDAAVMERHRLANATEIVATSGKLVDGAWSGALVVPADLPEGDYVLAVAVTGERAEWAASRTLKVAAPK